MAHWKKLRRRRSRQAVPTIGFACAAGVILATACGTDAGHVLTVAELDTIRAPTIHITAAELEAAPRLHMAPEPELEIKLWDDDAAAERSIITAEILSDSTIVIGTSDLGGDVTLEFFDWTGEAIRAPLAAGRSVNISIAPGDTLVLSGHGNWKVRVAPDSYAADTIFLPGNVVGSLSDGSLVVATTPNRNGETDGLYRREPTHYQILARELFGVRPDLWERMQGEIRRALSGVYADGRMRTLFVGIHESALGHLTFVLPWMRNTLALATGNRLWVMPDGRPEVVAIAPDGRVVLRIRWDGELAALSNEELETWKSREIAAVERPSNLSSFERAERIDEVRRFSPGDRRLRVGSTMRPGSDRSLWIRMLPRPLSEDTGTLRYLGFTNTGQLIGFVEIPTTADLKEISATHALVHFRGSPSVQRYRLVPVGPES
ncbi:MAG TPA: hypothetical protein VNZ57_00995 [Longimicrobiales bacterium]|nr:hypothetical protein [Longimicrobiales bacterium]